MNELNIKYFLITEKSISIGGIGLLFLFICLLVSCSQDDSELIEDLDQRDPVVISPDLQGASYDGPAPEYTKVNVFNNGLLLPGFQNFRIPVVVTTTHGTLLAFSEMRTGGDLEPKTLVYRRSTDNGETWGSVTLVEELTTSKIYGNENVVLDANTGNLHLIYLEIFTGSGANTCNMYHKISTDDGVTWSERKMIPNLINERWRPLGPGAGIQLRRGKHAGRLLIPGRYSGSQNGNYALYSDDAGETWNLGYRSVASNGVGSENESACVELNKTNGDESIIYINSRDQLTTENPHRRLEAYSEDSGESLLGSFERNAYFKTIKIQGDLFRWSSTDQGDDRNRILFSALAQFLPGSALHNRRHVGIWSSFDETDSWTPVAKRIHDLRGGYSSMVKTADGYVGILFEEGASSYYGETSFLKINEAFLDVPLIGARWDFEGESPDMVLVEGKKIIDNFSGGTSRNLSIIGEVPTTDGSTVFQQSTAVSFDGSSYLKLEDLDTWTQFDFHENASFTIELILRKKYSGDKEFLIGRPYQAEWPQWFLQFENDGKVSFRIDDDENFSVIKTKESIADNKWHHIAAVRDRATMKLKIYVDGVLNHEVSDKTIGSLANRRPLSIGGSELGGKNFEGEIDFIRITPEAMDEFLDLE